MTSTETSGGEMPAGELVAGLLSVTASIEREPEGPARAMLVALRERLAGELLGDVERTLAVVDDDFVLTVSQPGAPISRSNKSDLATSVEKFSTLAGEMLMWLELDHLVAAGEQLAGSGRMHSTFSAAQAASILGQEELSSGSYTATSQIGIFCRFRSGKMIEELILLIPDPAGLVPSPGIEIPDPLELARTVARLW
jgi:hypothetical protein